MSLLKIYLFTLLGILCIAKCTVYQNPKNSNSKNILGKLSKINSSDVKKHYLHFNKITDILNFNDYEVMLISKEYFPNIVFFKNDTLSFIFNVNTGVNFPYKVLNGRIFIYYQKNEVFKQQIKTPNEGSVLGEILLINETTFYIRYIPKNWVVQMNSNAQKNESIWFPSIFHCISP